jgi:hypothetical protein
MDADVLTTIRIHPFHPCPSVVSTVRIYAITNSFGKGVRLSKRPSGVQ